MNFDDFPADLADRIKRRRRPLHGCLWLLIRPPDGSVSGKAHNKSPKSSHPDRRRAVDRLAEIALVVAGEVGLERLEPLLDEPAEAGDSPWDANPYSLGTPATRARMSSLVGSVARNRSSCPLNSTLRASMSSPSTSVHTYRIGSSAGRMNVSPPKVTVGDSPRASARAARAASRSSSPIRKRKPSRR